jgi:hypothetical protein
MITIAERLVVNCGVIPKPDSDGVGIGGGVEKKKFVGVEKKKFVGVGVGVEVTKKNFPKSESGFVVVFFDRAVH